MSCLPGLRRSLHPARKLFKSLRTNLQFKLHKLNKSKILKKSKPRFKTTKSLSTRSSSYHPTYVPFKSKSNHQHRLGKRKQHHFTPPPAAGPPIYIDELFGSQEAVLKKYQAAEPSGKAVVEPFHRTDGGKKVSRGEDEQEMVVGGSDEGWRGSGGAGVSGVSEVEVVWNRVEIAGDEAWESVLLASPLMKGIDKRAEEFIARFRAELRSQETIASP